MSSDTRCGAFEKKEWFWGKGVVDPVEFSDRRGVRFQEAVQCQFVVEPGKKLAPFEIEEYYARIVKGGGSHGE